MAHRTKESVFSQLQLEMQDLESSNGLPFRELLSENRVLSGLNRLGVKFRDRIFNPMVTLWAFLSQVTAGKNSSGCENAASRVLADRVAHHQTACSADSSSYCTARCRLPGQVVTSLSREIGAELQHQAPKEWLWKGRRVVIADGSTATMADTPENQEEYPQSKNQKAGVGFPILRFVVLLSLAVGTALDCAIGPCRGKKTGEQSLFRQTWSALKIGDIVLGDRLYDCYRDIALLKAAGVDSLFGKKQSRKCDFRSGKRLRADDHIVVWKKPKYDASRYESRKEWESLPDQMEIREVRLTVRRKGYRTRTIIVVTTLLDDKLYSAQELVDLFHQRWHCELDLRSIKQALGMHHLTCKTPEMVRKELWVYLLAYNLIRVRMAQAAAVHGLLPRDLSFTAAKNHIHNFAPYLSTVEKGGYERLENELIGAIAMSRLIKRPGRSEPRAIKKRVQKYSYLTKPRDQARKGLAA